MAYLYVGCNGTEYIFTLKTQREYDSWASWGSSDSIELPKGSIFKLIGRELTWKDEPYNLDDMQRSKLDPLCFQHVNTSLEDELYPERKAQRLQEQLERDRAYWREEAKSLSDRELLEEIYVKLKTRWII